MANLTYVSNVVSGKTLHKIQYNVLYHLSDILYKSFGPAGSTTIIKKPNIETQYSKDGHTILKNVHFNGIIEEDIRENIETITRRVVTTVGDGTTSAVILSSFIFDSLNKLIDSDQYTQIQISKKLTEVCNFFKQKISDSAHACTVDDVYDIAMISTNGNEDISNHIYQVYKTYGTGVFIDVSPSLGEDTYLKEYDGMVLGTGLDDMYYVNTDKNTCVIDNPEVYFFEHPIDTREMMNYFDAIISRNIVEPINEANRKKINPTYIPTVIICPKISQDLSSYMDQLTSVMNQMQPSQRPPLLIITAYHQIDQFMDICDMCGAKLIRKYIDSKMYAQDEMNGIAPTPDNIFTFAGSCQMVESDTLKTKFVNPKMMRDDNGEFTTFYENKLDFLEKELAAAKERGFDARVTGALKRRINSMKCNMVEIFVGGISASDRDAVRDLVEDAVLNCRSACIYGVGWGANFNAYLAIKDEEKRKCEYTDDDDLGKKIVDIFYEAYNNIVLLLYNNALNHEDAAKVLTISELYKEPYNLQTKGFDGKVKCSIEGDIIIMDTICRIVSLMATSNQFIVPTPQLNVYEDFLSENGYVGIKNKLSDLKDKLNTIRHIKAK